MSNGFLEKKKWGELERVRGRALHAVVHALDAALVDVEVLVRRAAAEPQRDLRELRVLRPVLLQDQHELLRPAQREHGDQALPPLVDAAPHGRQKVLLALLPRVVVVDPVRGLDDEHVDAGGW